MARASNTTARREHLAAIAGFVVLTLFFFVRGFPREELENAAMRRFEAALGADAHFQQVEIALDWGVPKLRMRQGRLAWPGGAQLAVRYARAMPRASVGWLILRPSFYLKVNSDRGAFRGWLSPHTSTAEGTVEGLVLEALPYERLGLGDLRLVGLGELAFSGRQGETLWNGTVTFRAQNGSAELPGAPLRIPFLRLSGSVALDDQKAEILEALVFEGPMGRVSATGRVARGVPDPGLNLELQLELNDPNLLTLLAGSGLRIRPGARNVHIGGTVSKPIARATSASRR